MSGECSFFNFCLRGRDSLVSKWISQKRKIPETLKTDGANIYAISAYIHTVFYFDKLYGSDYSCNVLFNKIIAINELDKNHIVKFDEIIKISVDFTPCEFTERSFDDMAKDVSGAEFSAVTLGSVLSDTEIKELLINIYHINYDLRENENIKNKTYEEIISGRFIEFKDKSSLSFFIPYIFEISAKKVAESSKATVEVSLATSSIQPELSNTTVEGYFYTVDGDYAGKNGNSEDCYVLNEEVEISKNLDGAEYKVSQVRKLSIKHDDFRKQAATIYGESTAYKFGKSDKSANDEIFAIAEVFKVNKKAYGASSAQAKEFLKGTDKENKSWESRKAAHAAIIYTDLSTNLNKYSNGATHWDGREQAIYTTDKRGVTSDGEFTDDKNKSKFELHMNTWGWYIKDEHYEEWKKNIGAALKAPQKKKATYGMNKGRICALSTAVYNQTIFWKVKDGGYADDELK